jgi:ADP-ribosylation factor GTPase-activating protein 1
MAASEAYTKYMKQSSSVSQKDQCKMNDKDHRKLSKLAGNHMCVDCGASDPTWGSPDYGVLFCNECSGQHRGLGTHITYVRSVELDKWDKKQIKLMRAGGNDQCNGFFMHHGVDFTTIRTKYDCAAAQLYKQCLKARIEGLPEPTVLPPWKTQDELSAPRKMEGFGSASPPSPPTHKERLFSFFNQFATKVEA